MSNVTLRSLVKRFGDTVAVDNVDLEIESGSFTTLLGPSGCGKTTTLRLISGFIEPDEGDILIGGVSQKGVPPNRRATSIVFQDYAIFPHMTVFNNVAYGPRAHRFRKKDVRQRVNETLLLLGMEGLGDRYANQLSGGQQQRVAVARSVVLKPQVLLMDEPLSNLDAKLRDAVARELKQLQRQVGITTIYVTHDQTEALSMSDYIAVMNDGRIEQWGSPLEIYYEPQTKFVADFIGKANFIPAVIKDLQDDQCILEFGKGRILTCDAAVASHCRKGDEVEVMLRPHAISITDEAENESGIPGVVRERMFYGASARYWVEVDSNVLALNQKISPSSVLYDGRVQIMIDSEWIRLFRK